MIIKGANNEELVISMFLKLFSIMLGGEYFFKTCIYLILCKMITYFGTKLSGLLIKKNKKRTLQLLSSINISMM